MHIVFQMTSAHQRPALWVTKGGREVVQKVSKLLYDKIEPFQQAPDKQLEIVFIVTIVFERDVIFGLINS